MAIIRIKRSGSTGSPSALAQGEMGYSFLGGTQSNGGDRLYIGTGTETGGVAANIAVIGGKYFTDKLNHVPGTLTNNAAVIVDSSGRVDSFTANNLTTVTLSANGSVGTAGQLLASNGSVAYWATVSGTTNLGQTSNSSVIVVTSSTGTSTTLAAANSTIAGLISADAQTIAGVKTFSNDIVVSGNLTINGTTTTLNSTTLTVDDINIELGSVASPTDTTAIGGGITLKGTTDKTISWSAANGWTSSENFNLASGKTYKINGSNVLSSTTLSMSGSTSGTITVTPVSIAGTTSIILPATSGTLITTGDVETITASMIASIDGGTY
jgi:uncharacterized protein (DUF2147 family)